MILSPNDTIGISERYDSISECDDFISEFSGCCPSQTAGCPIG